MAEEGKIHFIWEKTDYSGFVGKGYGSSYLIVVVNPSSDMKGKYTNRMIISKKTCETVE